MRVYFPQWQGTDPKYGLQKGAELLKQYLGGSFEEIPLTDQLSPQKRDIKAYDTLYTQLQAQKAILEKKAPPRLFTLGGGCGVEILPVTYLHQHYGASFALIWLDAHADLNTPQSSPSKEFHGMPLRHILGEGDDRILDAAFSPLKPEQVFLLGLRATDPPEDQYIKKHDVYCRTAQAVKTQDVVTLLKTKAIRYVYFHVDLDVLDPEEFPHVPFPEPKGMTINQVREIIEKLSAAFEPVGLGLTECAVQNPDELYPLLPFREFIQEYFTDNVF